MKPCGHVLCRSCVDKFILPNAPDAHDPQREHVLACYVCDADLQGKTAAEGSEKFRKEKIGPGMVDLQCEGTGFASGGANQVKKDGVAFQC